jgi:hypothetical protein
MVVDKSKMNGFVCFDFTCYIKTDAIPCPPNEIHFTSSYFWEEGLFKSTFE